MIEPLTPLHRTQIRADLARTERLADTAEGWDVDTYRAVKARIRDARLLLTAVERLTAHHEAALVHTDRLARRLAAARASTLRQTAEEWAAHCPQHTDAENVWMDCPCEWVDELRRAATEAEPVFAVADGLDDQRAERLAAVSTHLDGVQPATDSALLDLAQFVAHRRDHEHPEGDDPYCDNLAAWSGERMGPVLRRLLDTELENARLRAELDARPTRDEVLREAAQQQRAEASAIHLTEPREANGMFRGADLLDPDAAYSTPEPLIVARYDTAIEPAPEEPPVLTIGAIAKDGRPVALFLDPDNRTKVARWLAPDTSPAPAIDA